MTADPNRSFPTLPFPAMSTSPVSPSLPPPSALRSFLAGTIRFFGTLVFRLSTASTSSAPTTSRRPAACCCCPTTSPGSTPSSSSSPARARSASSSSTPSTASRCSTRSCGCSGPSRSRPRTPRKASAPAAERLQAGEVVCMFPEGELTRTGTLLRLKKGFEVIARKGGAPVVPVWMDQLWGSIFSFEGGRFFRKLPQRFPYPVTVAFGEPLAPDAGRCGHRPRKTARPRRGSYEHRPMLRRHLAEACIRGLKNQPVAHRASSTAWTTRRSRAACSSRRPPCCPRTSQDASPASAWASSCRRARARVLANLAVLLAGKVPVSLNFTAGPRRARIRHAPRGDRHGHHRQHRRAQDGTFPWPENILRLNEVLPPLKKPSASGAASWP